jgi:hypothetical protein
MMKKKGVQLKHLVKTGNVQKEHQIHLFIMARIIRRDTRKRKIMNFTSGDRLSFFMGYG